MLRYIDFEKHTNIENCRKVFSLFNHRTGAVYCASQSTLMVSRSPGKGRNDKGPSPRGVMVIEFSELLLRGDSFDFRGSLYFAPADPNNMRAPKPEGVRLRYFSNDNGANRASHDKSRVMRAEVNHRPL